MSDDENKFLQYKREVIDPISKSFCAAKFYNATIWLGHGQTTSCHHPPAHNIPMDELNENFTAIHNTQHKKQMRKMMLEGERPQECEYCWKVEDMQRDSVSDRVYKTEIYDREAINEIAAADWREDVDLKTLEISFDRACNFACSYCNPAFSSTWVKDIKDYGAYQNIQSDGRGHFIDTAPWAERATKHEENNPYVQAFWKWWDHSLSENLDEIRVTGGEPMMHKSVWGLFDWFQEHRDSKMRFAINSNLVPEKQSLFDRLIKQSHDVPHLEIYTSNEAAGAQSEYIRDGMDYEIWMMNLRRLITESNVKRIHMMMTINSLCLQSITEFMDDMLALRKEFGGKAPSMTLNLLRFPSFQSPAILPDDLKEKFRVKIDTWKKDNWDLLYDHEKSHVQRLVDYLDVVKTPHSRTPETPALYHDFRVFYEQYDLRRKNKDFRKTFPDFVEWFDSIELISGKPIQKGMDAATTDLYEDDSIIAKGS